MPIYMVAIDANDLTVDPRAVRDVLDAHPEVTGWWNHLPGLFLVSTSLDAPGLRKVVAAATKNASLLVSAVDLARSDGWLPDTAWAWIGRREKQAEPVGA